MKTAYLIRLMPILFFAAWKQPSIGELQLILIQLASLLTFYLPFYLLARTLIQKIAANLRPLAMLTSISFAGLFYIVILSLAVPLTFAWVGLLVIAASLLFTKLGIKNLINAGPTSVDWTDAIFWCLLVFNVFTPDDSNPFFPVHSCDVGLAHLSIPKVYVENGHWLNTWWLRASFIPQLLQAQFAGQLALLKSVGIRADLISQLSNIWVFLAMVTSSRIVVTKSNSNLFGAILLSFSLTRWNLAYIHMDLASAAFVLAVGILFATSFSKPDLKSGAITGLMIGSALGAKHQTLLFSLPIAGIWLISRWISYREKHCRAEEIKFITGAVSTFFPVFFILFFHNWVLTGNPLFPFLFHRDTNAFHWDADTFKAYGDAIKFLLKDKGLVALIRSFFSITSEKSFFSDNHGYFFGYWFFVSLVVLIFTAIRVNSLRFLSLATIAIFGIHYIAWYYSSPVVRYLYPTLCLSVLMTLYLANELEHRWITAVIAFAVLATFIQTQNKWANFAHVQIPLTYYDTQLYLRKTIASYPGYEWIDQNTPKDTLIYTYGGSCEWLHSPRAIFGDWFGDTAYRTFHTGSPDEIKSFILKNQPDYILETKATNLRKLETQNDKLICLEGVVFEDEKIKIYKVSKSENCAATELSAIRETIPYQPKGFDYFFR